MKRSLPTILFLSFLLFNHLIVFGQSARSHVSDGNHLYKDHKYSDAEVEYRKSLEKDNQLLQGYYDLGDAVYKQNRFDEAVQNYTTALSKTKDPKRIADLHYNIGNAYLENKKYQESIESYKRSLKLEPNDEDAKYNLAYALEKLKEKDQKQQNQKQNNKNNQQNKDQQKKDQNKQNQQQQNQQKNQADNKPQPQQEQQQKHMSQAEAERILNALSNDEKSVQKKLRTHPVVRGSVEKDW